MVHAMNVVALKIVDWALIDGEAAFDHGTV